MSRLADIYKSEKKSGGGILSTVGKRTLEKIDPRQLFDQSGLLAAMAPTLFKKYSATSMKKEKPTLSPTPQAPLQDAKMDLIIKQNQDVITNTKISAKNSLMFPGMARDLNVMRQNMVKMVKLQGGTAATKADMFFKTAKEREAEYEVKFQKDGAVSPTPTGGKDKPEGKGGILGMLSGLIPAIISGIGTLGSKVLSSIGGAISGLGSLILQGITSALSIDNLMKVFGIAGNVISGFAKLLPMLISPTFLGIVAAIAGATWLMKFLQKKNDEANTEEKINERIAADRGSQSSKMAARTLLINKDLKSLLADDRTDQDVSDYTRGEIKTKDELAKAISSAEGAGKRAIVITDSRVAAEARQNLNPPVSYNAAKDSQAASETVGRSSSGRVTPMPATTTPVQVPSTTPEGMQNYNSRTPTQMNSTAQTGSNGEFNSKEDFLTAMYPLAVKASEALGGVDPNALLTQWGFESAWGSKTSGKFNYFGIKADKSWNGDKKDVMTHEFIGGEKVKIPQPFRSYNNPEEAVDDYVRFLKNNKRYEKAGVFRSKTSEDFFGSLQKAGYATDPNYAAKLTKATQSTARSVASLSLPDMPRIDTLVTQAPTAPPVTLAAAAPTRPSSIISDSTVALAEVKERTSSTPIVVNAPQTVNNVQQGSQAVTQYTAPSIVDSEFMRMLVSRAV
jgi:flagellar rod assembly protein/muramidase FlgJ